jgi:hypothetical protein
MTTPEADMKQADKTLAEKKRRTLAGSATHTAPAVRMRRPQPERDAPLRASRSTLASNGAARPEAEEQATNAAQKPAASADDVKAEASGSVSAAVAMAYRVVERNIKEGREAAERLSAAGAQTPNNPTIKSAANRLLHMTREYGSALLDLASSVVHESDARGLIERFAGNGPQPSQPEAVVVQRISSRKPVEVSLSSLAPTAVEPPPGLAGLHSLDAGSRPIEDVRFLTRAGGGLELHIVVPDQQPAGIYSGVIVDGQSQLPLGTLSVKVFE